MSAWLYRLLLLIAVVGAFFWLQIPILYRYAPQVFSGVLIIYFLLKRLSRTKAWHLAPSVLSFEMPLVTFAFLLLIGSTGNLHSLLIPASYIHLFFLVFASDILTSILILVLVMFFHYFLTPQLTSAEISHLVSLPVMMVFFIFAKAQYQQAQQEKSLLLEEEKSLLQIENQTLEERTFLSQVLSPKLGQLQQLLKFPQQNQTTLQGQVAWLQLQLETLLNSKK